MAILIDISHWDPEFDPTFSGGILHGAIIKGADGLVPDERAMKHIEVCQRRSFPFGVYLYYRTNVPAIQQLEFLYNTYHPLGARFFALDFEPTLNLLSVEKAKECVAAILAMRSKYADSLFVLYTNRPVFRSFFYPIWRPEYKDTIPLWHAQYPFVSWYEPFFNRVASGDFSYMKPPDNTKTVLWQFTAYAPAQQFGVRGKKVVDLNVVVDPSVLSYLSSDGPATNQSHLEECGKIKEVMMSVVMRLEAVINDIRGIL